MNPKTELNNYNLFSTKNSSTHKKKEIYWSLTAIVLKFIVEGGKFVTQALLLLRFTMLTKKHTKAQYTVAFCKNTKLKEDLLVDKLNKLECETCLREFTSSKLVIGEETSSYGSNMLL